MTSPLTDEDKRAIGIAMGEYWNGVFLIHDIARVYAAGLAEGARRQRERDAKICDIDLRKSKGRIWEEACAACAAAIRAGETP